MSLIHNIIINVLLIDWVLMYKNKIGVVDIKGGFEINYFKFLLQNI